MEIEQIWNDYGNLLRRFLFSKVGNSDDAEDLLQEILIKTHKSMHSLKDPKKFKSWLFQIARNTLIDYYRKPSKTISEQSIPELSEIVEESSDAQETMRSELSECIKPFLESLPKKYADAVEAIDLKGISQKEMAKELRLSYSTAKSRVQRGRQKLAELFQECCTYEVDARGKIIGYKPKNECC